MKYKVHKKVLIGDFLSHMGKYKEGVEAYLKAEAYQIVITADLYWILGKKKRAMELYGEIRMRYKLIRFSRELNKDENYELIEYSGIIFSESKHHQCAAEAYLILVDMKAIVMMNIELNKYEEAFLLAQKN